MTALIESLFMGLFAAVVVIILLYGLAHWLQLAKFPKTKLKQQLYMSGETIVPKKRRYQDLNRMFIWLSYFSTSHVIGFMIGTLLVLTALGVSGFDFVYPVIYIVFVAFAILSLAKQPSTSK